MKSIKIAICDDSEADIKDLSAKLELYGINKKCEVIVRVFHSGSEFIEKFQPIYDLVFLDIRLPDVEGDVLAAKIRKADYQIPVIFISNYLDAIFKGYKLNIQAYIKKPASYQKIEREIDEAIEKNAFMTREFFLENSRDNTYKIYYSQLIYVETDGRGSLLHYNGDIIESRKKIGEYEKILDDKGFYRCSNSYIVNLRWVENVQRSHKRYDVVMITGERIPMSRVNKDECMKRILAALK